MATKTTIKPLGDNVLVKPAKAEEVSAGGILLPGTVKEKPQIGEVMAVGEGWHNNEGKIFPLSVKVGQKVIYTKWGGNEVKVGNQGWKIVKQGDILAIVE